MDLHDEYRSLHAGAVAAVDRIHQGRRAGILTDLAADHLRRLLAEREDFILHADSVGDVADDFAALARMVAGFDDLCRELFADLHHDGRPEPPWRVVAPGRLAVRATSQVRRRQPLYALATGPGAAWTFRVFPSGAAGDDAVVVEGSVSPDPRPLAVADWTLVTAEWCDQLGYGLRALGMQAGLPLRPGT